MIRPRNRTSRRLVALGTAVIAVVVATQAQSLTVFDPANYQQNLLSAARALESIQNQVRQLQNEAAELLRMDRHLLALPGSISPDMQATLTRLQARIADGDALALKVRDTEAAYAELYPTAFSDALNGDDLVRTAKSRWDETHASFKRAALLQGEITEATQTDTRLLEEILARSTNAVGGLQAAQAGNELSALHVKQALQLQVLVATQARAETTDRARALVAQEQARAQFRSFLGDGRAYTRGK